MSSPGFSLRRKFLDKGIDHFYPADLIFPLVFRDVLFFPLKLWANVEVFCSLGSAQYNQKGNECKKCKNENRHTGFLSWLGF